MSANKLDGKVAIITGAASGIGRATKRTSLPRPFAAVHRGDQSHAYGVEAQESFAVPSSI